ncbi:MAG: hypothetical protein QOD86_1067 [Miltoncostaeaceae bacterium]|jgi:hypothetical protein|nr:hypothetical protein [Miltoncostaeaceae bacterium]
MPRPRIAAALCALAAVAALAGCVSNEPDAPSPPATPTPPAAPTAPATPTRAAPGDDPAGAALLEKANAYYAAAPSLSLDLRSGGTSVGRFDLERGRLVASVGTSGGVTFVVTRTGGYSKGPGDGCWTRSSGQTPSFERFTSPIQAFIPLETLDVSAPIAEGELMRVDLTEKATGEPTPFSVTIDPDTGRIAALSNADGTLTYREVADPPPVPATTPVCATRTPPEG